MGDELSAKVLTTLSECVDGVVTEFAVICSFVDSDGDRRIWTTTLEDQRCHQTIGLLGFALAVETDKAASSFNA